MSYRFQMHEMEFEHSPAGTSSGKYRIFSFGNQLISEGYASCLWWVSNRACPGALTNSMSSSPIARMTIHRMLCVFLSQVTCPGTRPSLTRFPATRHQCDHPGASWESLGGRASELLVSKDPRAPRASQEMQVCQAPQESEVSRLCSLYWVR